MELSDTDARTAFFGGVYGYLGLAAGILQLVIVPLALRFVDLRVIHVGVPMVHLVSGLVLTISPSLRSGTAAYVIFKALDYSIFRAAKELFYMPLSYDSRYRAKQLIDSFVYRSSKSGGATVIGLVKLVVQTIPGIAFSITAMVAAMVWTPVVLSLTRAYQKLVNTEDA